jgi:integrase
MGHKTVHIERRNGRWHFRRRVPQDLRQYIPRKEIRASLKTKSYDDAVMLVRLRDAEIDRVFSLLRCGVLNNTQRDHVIGTLFPDRQQSITTFEQAINSYLVDRKPGLSTRTQQDYTYFADVLKVEFCKRNLSDIARTDLITFRERIGQKRAPATVNKYLSWLQSFFGWCFAAQLITNNPAAGITRIKDDARRERFTADELQTMYLLIEEYRWSSQFPQRYWVPLISLLMGLRLTEAMQLVRSDVQKKDNVWCLWVNDRDGRSVKTQNSERFVPIHPMLIELGFLEYINLHIGFLWPINVESNRISNAFSCWFSQRIRPQMTNSKGKTFHSLRHTFVDELKQMGVSEQFIAELVGHSRGSLTMERYGKKYLPHVLEKELMKLDGKRLINIDSRHFMKC